MLVAVEVEPRREAHHSLTWKYLYLGSPLRLVLPLIMGGAAWRSLSLATQEVIARFRFFTRC